MPHYLFCHFGSIPNSQLANLNFQFSIFNSQFSIIFCAPLITFQNSLTHYYSELYIHLSHIFCDKAYHTLLRML